MSVRAVIFDLGGVLEINPETGWQGRWARRLGISEAALEAQLEAIWTPGATGEASLGELELVSYFASLRPRYRTAILSDSFVGAREREHAAYGFADMCDLIVYSHQEGVGKPDPRANAMVCDRLGVAPADTVLLDDAAACVDGARAVGMAAVQFEDSAHAIVDLTRLLAADER